MNKQTKPVVAFVYDFDGTLAPGNMQEHSFIPNISIDKEKFWEQVIKTSQQNSADNILIYMHEMLEKARHAHKPIRRGDIKAHGKGIPFFPGVREWFERTNRRGENLGLSVEHYIISSGLHEMIGETSISHNFKRIFASSFLYDANEIAIWPSLAVNYTTKTQYLFRINKGTLDVSDHSKINKFMQDKDRPIPFHRIIFIGDGETDVPCMRLVSDKGGYAIAVYQPHKKNAKHHATELLENKRARFATPADYSEGSKLDKLSSMILKAVAARETYERFLEDLVQIERNQHKKVSGIHKKSDKKTHPREAVTPFRSNAQKADPDGIRDLLRKKKH